MNTAISFLEIAHMHEYTCEITIDDGNSLVFVCLFFF